MKILFTIFLLVFSFTAFAQTRSLPIAPTTTPSYAAVATPTPVTSATSTSATSSLPIPVATTSPPRPSSTSSPPTSSGVIKKVVLATSTSIIEIPGATSTLPEQIQFLLREIEMLVALIVSFPYEEHYTALFSLLGLFVLLWVVKRKVPEPKKNDGDEKNDHPCMSIKEMLDSKYEELTDLRGKLQSKAEDTAREKVRDVAEGTVTGKVLAQIEEAEAEYNRLKDLFEKCMTEFKTEVKAIIFDLQGVLITKKSIPEELPEYLKKLREKDISLFILSNSTIDQAKYYRSHFSELFENFDAVYFACETGFFKPRAEAFQHILDTHKLKPEEVLYFDDSHENILSAEKLGIDVQLWSDFETARKYIDTNVAKK